MKSTLSMTPIHIYSVDFHVKVHITILYGISSIVSWDTAAWHSSFSAWFFANIIPCHPIIRPCFRNPTSGACIRTDWYYLDEDTLDPQMLTDSSFFDFVGEKIFMTIFTSIWGCSFLSCSLSWWFNCDEESPSICFLCGGLLSRRWSIPPLPAPNDQPR